MGDARIDEDGVQTASHDPQTPEALVDFMSREWAQSPAGDVAPEPSAQWCARRRAALSARFPGEWLVVPTGGEKIRANDAPYRFRSGSDFFWLTGNLEPDGVLVMEPTGAEGHRSVLYVEPRADRRSPAFFTDRANGELWVGPRRGVLESAAAHLIDTEPLGGLADHLGRIGDASARIVRGVDARVDPLLDTDPDADQELFTVLSELRLVKDAHEIEMLEAAVASTVRGFEDIVRALPRSVTERWVEGVFNLRARVEGNDVGYDPIAAAGAHACILHWRRNDGPVTPGELLLVDAGVESLELYTADVTRTLPVSGRFSDAQREVYELVRRAQQAGVDAVRPGAAFTDPHRAAMRVIVDGLVDMGILRCTADEALDPAHQYHRRYTLHSTSHMLGIDVHDCAQAREEHYRGGPLQPGMVLTVEPGLYFQPDDLTVPERYRGIGVRIEDDVLVTEDGRRNLSEALPRAADEVEMWMARLLEP
jgi:Xaa-Pro aminopeptidase